MYFPENIDGKIFCLAVTAKNDRLQYPDLASGLTGKKTVNYADDAPTLKWPLVHKLKRAGAGRLANAIDAISKLS